jgi:hypothetical protein
VRYDELAFPSDLLEQTLHVLAILVDHFMSFLESNALYAVKVVTAREYASGEEHLKSKIAKVEFLHCLELVHVDLNAIAGPVHLKETLFNPKG